MGPPMWIKKHQRAKYLKPNMKFEIPPGVNIPKHCIIYLRSVAGVGLKRLNLDHPEICSRATRVLSNK